jgi:hypothetical protein
VEKLRLQRDTYKPFISGKEYSREHGFVQKEVSHPLADDDVYFFWKFHILHLQNLESHGFPTFP